MSYSITYENRESLDTEHKAINDATEYNPDGMARIAKHVASVTNAAIADNERIQIPAGLRNQYGFLLSMVGIKGYPVKAFYRRLVRVARAHNRNIAIFAKR